MSTKKNNEIIPYKEESNEIVKRIESPEPEERLSTTSNSDYYTDTTYDNNEYHQTEYYQSEYSQEEKKTKSIIPIFAGLTTIGIIGYFGFNYLQQDNNIETKNKVVAGVADTNTSSVNGTKEELISYYVGQSLEAKKKSKSVEETTEPIKKVIETTPTIKEPETIEKESPKIESITKEVKTAPIVIEKEIEEKKEPVVKEAPIVETEKIVISEKEEIKEESITKTEERVLEAIKAEESVKTEKKKEIFYDKIKPRVVTIRDNDSLVSLAERFYGNSMDFKRIIRANSKIRSSKTPLRLGQKIVIPRKDGKKRRRYVVVEKGDTLASISKAIYGNTDRISTIVRANYKIKSKRTLLRLGQKVYVPRLKFLR